jgi:hypothetical protein
MKMNSNFPGAVNSHSEVTDISSGGFWILVDDREYFIPFDQYPAFRKATVSQIYRMEPIGSAQFSWPDLDIDIEIEALEQPERFPLEYRE